MKFFVNSGNSRNGYYERTINSRFADLNIRFPHDRNENSPSRLFLHTNRIMDSSETTVIQLYKKGITTRGITDLIKKNI